MSAPGPAHDDPDAIADDLWLVGHHDELRHAIVRTAMRLPPDVRLFTVRRCRFVMIGPETVGSCFSAAIFDRREDDPDWVIVLMTTAEDVIAHEIAHAWLRHDTDEQGMIHDGAAEEEVRRTLAEWGFAFEEGGS